MYGVACSAAGAAPAKIQRTMAAVTAAAAALAAVDTTAATWMEMTWTLKRWSASASECMLPGLERVGVCQPATGGTDAHRVTLRCGHRPRWYTSMSQQLRLHVHMLVCLNTSCHTMHPQQRCQLGSGAWDCIPIRPALSLPPLASSAALHSALVACPAACSPLLVCPSWLSFIP